MFNPFVLFLLVCSSVIVFVLYSNTLPNVDYIQETIRFLGSKKDGVHSFATCNLTKYNPWNDEIIKFYNPSYDPYRKCNRSFEIVTKLENSKIVVTKKDVYCWGRCMEWISDTKIDWKPWQPSGEVMNCDIILSQCATTNKSSATPFYQNLHAQIVEKKENISRPINRTRKYDIHVLMIDSTGMGQAERGMSQTLNYLRNSMNAITFPNYNKIGHNSYPNGIALLLGMRIEPVFRTWFGLPDLEAVFEPCNVYVDNTSHVFKAFRNNGYKTLWTENWKAGIVSVGGCKGFKEKPTDHIMNHLYNMIASAKEPLKSSVSYQNCFNSYQHLINYMGEFIEAYNDSPKFSFIWDTNLGHYEENGVVPGDAPTTQFLIKHRKKLDDSFFILLADHGMRFGKAASTQSGIYENYNPMFTISVPRELRNNTDLMKILRKNSQKLQTIWDLRATLFDIMEVDRSKSWSIEPLAKFERGDGSSMLRRQNEDRTCQTLPIPFSYCLCHFDRQTMNSSSPVSIKIGQAAVETINNQLVSLNISSQCHKWELKQVKFIETIVGSEAYSIIVLMKEPHPAEFKLIMHRNSSSGLSTYEGRDPDRLDKYGDRGNCVRQSFLCECKK